MSGLGSLTALVVDDYALMTQMLRSILLAIGIGRVQWAYSGEKGLELARKEEPDLVFTDLTMKPMDGVAFTRRLRDRQASPIPFVPIIMVSGHSERHNVTEARDAGVTEFLVKPISARTLYDRLVAVIENPRPFIDCPSYFGPCRRRHDDETYEGDERRLTPPREPGQAPGMGLPGSELRQSPDRILFR